MSLTAHSPRRVGEIVESGLCTGCGLCASLAGDKIQMGLNVQGFMRPMEVEPVDETMNREILAICPGVSVTGPGASAGAERTHPVWGPVREMHRTWSAEPDVRHQAAAGGTLTALGRYLLSSGEVDAVVHVKASPRTPWLTDAVVSRTPEEILDGSQSRYGPAAPLVHVHRLLDEGLRFALIAKPCDVSAIRALGRSDARVAEQVPYLLTIFCGGVHHAGVPKSMIRYHGVDENDVEVFRYRGNGWPGPTHIQTKTGVTHDVTYRQAWLVPAPWRYDMQFRCKICPDAIGESADISAPDGWILKDGKPIHEEAPGVNATIARTEKGQKLLDLATEAGYLDRARLTVDELDQMHHNHLPRKLGWPAVAVAMTLLRQPMLVIRGYRGWTTVRRAGLSLSWRQFTGTARRVLRGDNRESRI